jgi:hypothetical protein
MIVGVIPAEARRASAGIPCRHCRRDIGVMDSGIGASRRPGMTERRATTVRIAYSARKPPPEQGMDADNLGERHRRADR